MYVVHSSRDVLLECLPKGARAAEIGVYTGCFSEAIYEKTCPMELHLIDPWEFQDDEDYQLDRSNVPQDRADQHYEQVRQKFAPQIQAEVIKLHRDYSHNVVEQFEDGFFDWIYIDANHTYEACLNDLRLYAPKVKAEGFICGHDYANHPEAMKANFGVVEAVNDFVRETNHDLTLLTFEAYPTYVISKSVEHHWYRVMIANAIAHCGVHTEVLNVQDKSFQQQIVGLSDGTMRLYYAFD